MSHQTHLPSPAPSPFPGAAGAGTAPDPDTVRTELEAQLLRLSQDLYEMEVCAGEVAPGMEDAVPNYL
jgi:mediator of RNA polymerase II transcription subunit 10